MEHGSGAGSAPGPASSGDNQNPNQNLNAEQVPVPGTPPRASPAGSRNVSPKRGRSESQVPQGPQGAQGFTPETWAEISRMLAAFRSSQYQQMPPGNPFNQSQYQQMPPGNPFNQSSPMNRNTTQVPFMNFPPGINQGQQRPSHFGWNTQQGHQYRSPSPPQNFGHQHQAPPMNQGYHETPNTGYTQNFPGQGQFPHNTGYDQSSRDQNKRVTLDEKYFRRCEKFDGDTFKFRPWLFDLLVAIGQIDGALYDETKEMLQQAKDEEFDPASCEELSLYQKYKSELYGVVVSLTFGEAKSVVRGISESGNNNDGFKALVVLQCRYDKKTKANLLRTFLDVTNPPGIKVVNTIIMSIHAWESKVSILKS